jgi:hypothetical protein
MADFTACAIRVTNKADFNDSSPRDRSGRCDPDADIVDVMVVVTAVQM